MLNQGSQLQTDLHTKHISKISERLQVSDKLRSGIQTSTFQLPYKIQVSKPTDFQKVITSVSTSATSPNLQEITTKFSTNVAPINSKEITTTPLAYQRKSSFKDLLAKAENILSKSTKNLAIPTTKETINLPQPSLQSTQNLATHPLSIDTQFSPAQFHQIGALTQTNESILKRNLDIGYFGFVSPTRASENIKFTMDGNKNLSDGLLKTSAVPGNLGYENKLRSQAIGLEQTTTQGFNTFSNSLKTPGYNKEKLDSLVQSISKRKEFSPGVISPVKPELSDYEGLNIVHRPFDIQAKSTEQEHYLSSVLNSKKPPIGYKNNYAKSYNSTSQKQIVPDFSQIERDFLQFKLDSFKSKTNEIPTHAPFTEHRSGLFHDISEIKPDHSPPPESHAFFGFGSDRKTPRPYMQPLESDDDSMDVAYGRQRKVQQLGLEEQKKIYQSGHQEGGSHFQKINGLRRVSETSHEDEKQSVENEERRISGVYGERYEALKFTENIRGSEKNKKTLGGEPYQSEEILRNSNSRKSKTSESGGINETIRQRRRERKLRQAGAMKDNLQVQVQGERTTGSTLYREEQTVIGGGNLQGVEVRKSSQTTGQRGSEKDRMTIGSQKVEVTEFVVARGSLIQEENQRKTRLEIQGSDRKERVNERREVLSPKIETVNFYRRDFSSGEKREQLRDSRFASKTESIVQTRPGFNSSEKKVAVMSKTEKFFGK